MQQARRYVSRADVKETMQSVADRIHDRGTDVNHVQNILASNVLMGFTVDEMVRLFHIMKKHILAIITWDMIA